MVKANPRIIFFLHLALIIGLGFAVYANSLANSFIWDDYQLIVNNDFVKSWANLPDVFNKSYLSPFIKRGCCFFVDFSTGSGESYYRPVVTLSYFVDYSLWRLKPFGYHLTNLTLHIINALVLYFLIGLIVPDRKIALLGSLLFALHPVNSEAVNNISFREDLLAFLFYMSSFALFIKSGGSRGIRRALFYIASLILFFPALFSKEMAITLPFLLVLYDYYFIVPARQESLWARFKSRYGGYIIIALFYIWVRFFLIANNAEPPLIYPGGSFYSDILTMSRVAAAYIKWLIFPVGIIVSMPAQSYMVSTSIANPRVLSSLFLITAILAIAVKMRRRSRDASFGVLWFFIALLPVSNIIPISNYIAGRYLYMPLAGFSLAFSIFLLRLDNVRLRALPLGMPRQARKDIIVLILAFYFIFTVVGNALWRNDTVFFGEMAERYPDNALVHLSLGNSLRRDGLAADSVAEYKTAIGLNPVLADAYNGLGMAFGSLQQYGKAKEHFLTAIKIDPLYTAAYNNLGVTYAQMKKWQEAKKCWRMALRIKPGYKEAEANLNKIGALSY